MHLNHANDVGESTTSEPNSLWENVTSEPNSLWENVTSEPNSLWENVTSEPKLAADGVDGESVEMSAGTNGGDHAYLETEMDEEKVGEWIRSGIERQRELRAKALRALNATRPEVHEARAARRSRGGGNETRNAEHRRSVRGARRRRHPSRRKNESTARTERERYDLLKTVLSGCSARITHLLRSGVRRRSHRGGA